MQYRHAIIKGTGERLDIPQTDDERFLCPICGEMFGTDPTVAPWDESIDRDAETGLHYGFGSINICPCCHMQWGVDDSSTRWPSVAEGWRQLRIKWLNEVGWSESALRQVRENLGLTEEQLRRDADASGKR